MKNEGFWYDCGDFFMSCFTGLEWLYETLSPNKILIAVGFVAVASWVYVQQKYTAKARKEGTLR